MLGFSFLMAFILIWSYLVYLFVYFFAGFLLPPGDRYSERRNLAYLVRYQGTALASASTTVPDALNVCVYKYWLNILCGPGLS